jgi:threonine aldolase
VIDLRSDTVTTPTDEMRKAMATAEVGDDVFREDPTVAKLQEKAALIFERDAALFVPTGTMGNQIAVKLHTRPGQEVITEARGHIYNWEMAMTAAFSGCLVRPVAANRGILTWEKIAEVLSPDVYYRASTGLVALENTHNMAGGTIMPAEIQHRITEKAGQLGLPVHLDGARIFNAAAALETDVAQLAKGCQSVMFCLSKGLSAPAGSMLVGSRDFIEEAWSVRKMLGGGMRQVGILAAAGLVALEKMPERLWVDHQNARKIAEGMADLPFFRLDLDSVQTNIVIADLIDIQSRELVARLSSEGVLVVSTGPRQIRLVTHRNISSSDVEKVLSVLRQI